MLYKSENFKILYLENMKNKLIYINFSQSQRWRKITHTHAHKLRLLPESRVS
jgi:hypothetical protein